MGKRIFEVVHPDGTVSERSSTSRTYTHAVEVRRVTALDVAEARESLAQIEEVAAQTEQTLATGERETKVRDLGQGKTITDLYVVNHETGSRVFLASWRDEDAPTEETIQAEAAAYRERNARYVAQRRQRLAEAEALPEFTYAVARWSASLENATKGLAHREVRFLAEQGHSLRVVEAVATDRKRLGAKR